MSKVNVTCPICKYKQNVREQRITASMVSCDCPVCGKYEIPVFVPKIHGADVPNRRLSAWVREQNERGESVRFAKEKTIENVLASILDYTFLEKQLKLLQAVARRSDGPGAKVVLSSEKDVPLAYSNSPEELAFCLRALEERELLRHSTVIWNVMITPHGWDYLDKHARDLEEKTQGFVAMSFSEEMKPLWENAIKSAIQEAGYTAYCIDEEPHSDNIIFKIMAEMKNAKFVIADVTEQKNGVYFEAGYALGLGLPVIWSVRKDDTANVHFDTAQYNQIRWERAEELKEGLLDYICAIIGRRN